MLPNPRPHSQPESVRELFDDLSNAPAKKTYCPKCGSLHAHIDAQFWLEGTELRWTIALPYCQSCNPGIDQRQPFAA